MDISWDNIKDKLFSAKESAGKYAKIAIDKTTETVDKAKLSYAKGETERKISKLYEKIGKQMYDEYLEGSEFDGELGEIMTEIDKFKEEIDEIESKISNIKDYVKCPECGEKNTRTDEFCIKCGTKITDDNYEGNETDSVVDISEADEKSGNF